MRRLDPRARRWLAAVTLAATAYCAGIVLAPWLEHRGSAAGSWLRLAFAPTCHQQPDRCLDLGGGRLAVCARCSGLYAGGVLNGFERCGDVFEIGGPALFLRHVSATAWDNAFINFDQNTWFPAPNYVVMQLWRNHYAPHRVEITGGSDKLNVVATKSEDGRTLYVKCVNPRPAGAEVSLSLPEGLKPAMATMQVVAPGSLQARNTLAKPDAIRAAPGQVQVDAGTARISLPPLSAAVVTIRL